MGRPIGSFGWAAVGGICIFPLAKCRNLSCCWASDIDTQYHRPVPAQPCRVCDFYFCLKFKLKSVQVRDALKTDFCGFWSCSFLEFVLPKRNAYIFVFFSPACLCCIQKFHTRLWKFQEPRIRLHSNFLPSQFLWQRLRKNGFTILSEEFCLSKYYLFNMEMQVEFVKTPETFSNYIYFYILKPF